MKVIFYKPESDSFIYLDSRRFWNEHQPKESKMLSYVTQDIFKVCGFENTKDFFQLDKNSFRGRSMANMLDGLADVPPRMRAKFLRYVANKMNIVMVELPKELEQLEISNSLYAHSLYAKFVDVGQKEQTQVAISLSKELIQEKVIIDEKSNEIEFPKFFLNWNVFYPKSQDMGMER